MAKACVCLCRLRWIRWICIPSSQLACNVFKKILNMLKSQSACYSFTRRWGIISVIIPSISLAAWGQLAKIWYRVHTQMFNCLYAYIDTEIWLACDVL